MAVNDYQALSYRLVNNPNGNYAIVLFDALGMAAEIVLMGIGM